MIPEHLRPFIATQEASLYTPMDHASWRFILRVSKAFFSKNAHSRYLRGLEETGISLERIPLVEEMDQKLQCFGWRAVPVSGFIPPAVFMEFQSLGILPIACEMRTIDHLAYTPAPDIVHEAAGHAPIISNPEYAAYLREYGEISRKAIFSHQDMELFEAIRDLSDIKEDPRSTELRVLAAQKRVDETVARSSYVSEATYLARMNWWTVEYGLVGREEEPMIYGAGLLSSVGESYNCLKPEIRKIPFTLDCVNTSYDITRPQPQLFVARDFSELTDVLEEFAATMAYQKGGTEGLAKAKIAATVTTTMLDSGLQISGVLAESRRDDSGEVVFLKYSGPCQLAYLDSELENQGPKAHPDGFSTPIGHVKGLGRSVSQLSQAELESLGFRPGQVGRLSFESGIELSGSLASEIEKDGIRLALRFNHCTIRWGAELLYQPDWGTFDLACGARVTSVFGGAADRAHYTSATGGYRHTPRSPKTNLTEQNLALNEMYAEVRKLRESKASAEDLNEALPKIHAGLEESYPADWLLRLELLELDSEYGLNSAWHARASQRLDAIAASANDKRDMIQRGRELLKPGAFEVKSSKSMELRTLK